MGELSGFYAQTSVKGGRQFYRRVRKTGIMQVMWLHFGATPLMVRPMVGVGAAAGNFIFPYHAAKHTADGCLR
jgi:hypothetical protein